MLHHDNEVAFHRQFVSYRRLRNKNNQQAKEKKKGEKDDINKMWTTSNVNGDVGNRDIVFGVVNPFPSKRFPIDE